MADKSRTIKNATDDELDKLLIRLRKESDAQNLIRRILENSDPHAYRYDHRPAVSTETPIKDLYHYGIPGMKWGVRKGKGTPRAKGRSKADPVKKLSDAELKKRIGRMQMEKQYKQLTAKEKSKGRKLAEDIIKEVAKETAKSYARKYATKAVESAIKAAKG